MKLVALVSFHNRREKTLSCLRALTSSALPDGSTLDVIVVDDGSTDGTASAISSEFPSATILMGDGEMYWTKGMHLAFETAIQRRYDAYLWLNDDTILFVESLRSAISFLRSDGGATKAIFVGSTLDPLTRTLTYGGFRVPSRLKPFALTHVQPSESIQPCDTMNGNFVLIPQSVVQKVGNLDPHFAHAMGDVDYGLRARKLGVPIHVLPGYIGECPRNSVRGTFADQSLPRAERWRRMMSPKGLPPKSWRRLVQRHAGPLWPLYWAYPYLKAALW